VVSPMEYVTVTAGQPALAPVDPQRPPYGQPGWTAASRVAAWRTGRTR